MKSPDRSSDSCSPVVMEKWVSLEQVIRECGPMVIAYSGGVDSSLLAVIASRVLPGQCRCILLDSPVVPRDAVQEAREIAERFGLALEILPVDLMADERFTKNPEDRCYWCKKNSAQVLRKRAGELGISCIADGINGSDRGEHRPGIAASTEEGIIHPFLEAGITKEDIRAIARETGLPFHDKPSAACLSSRIPYGDRITKKNLGMTEQAEAILHRQGFRQARVRIHGTIARIEVPKGEMHHILEIRDEMTGALKALGFSYVCLDLEGYRSGSMDEVLPGRRAP